MIAMVLTVRAPLPPIAIVTMILFGVVVGAAVLTLDFGLRSRRFLRRPLADLRRARAAAVQARLFDTTAFTVPPLRGLRLHQAFQFPKPSPGLRERLWESLEGQPGLEARILPDGRLIAMGRRDRFLNLNAPHPFDFRQVEFTFRGSGDAMTACEYTVDFEGLGRVAVILGSLALIIAGGMWIAKAPWPLPVGVLLMSLLYGVVFVHWRYVVQVVSTARFLDQLLIDGLTAR